MVAEDDETLQDKKIDKLMDLSSLSFKKIYKPTNNNLRTSSNIDRENQDNSPRINKSDGYENQRIGNVVGAKETVGSTVVQKSEIQCYNCKEFRHVARECQKQKRAKDAAYHREKMLLCKQEEAGIQLNAEQADWRDDTDDDDLEDQELEAHYMYMAQLQEVSPDAADSGPIYDDEPLQKNDDDNDLAKERELLACLIKKLKCEIDESKNHNKFLETSNKVLIENLKAPDSDEVIRLEKESRSKLSDLIRPFDYDKLNNLYDLFVPQREKSSEQRCFSERSRLSHTNDNNGKSKEFFNKQTTLLEKRMDESIPLDKKCQSSIEIFKVKTYVNRIINGVELCKEKIDNRTYIGYIVLFIQNTIESNFSPVISRINAGLDQFHRCLNEEMVADLRYFNSLELEVDSLRSQLETPKTQFLNEIDRLSREYYYTDHMNTIIGVYTELDEVTNLECDYLELLEKCEGLETELSKSKMMSKNFESDLKAQLQEKGIVIRMYKPHTDHNQDRTSQLPQDSRKTNKCVSFSTGVISTTNVNRPQLKSNPMGDRVIRNNSQGKKQEVEDQSRNVKLSKNKTSVNACNDSLNAKTLNVKSVSAMCDKCLVEIFLFIVDSGCSKHMTGNLKLLINFVEKFLGTVKFGNDQIAPILGYGDLVQRAVMIKRVYYVEGLNHNLFSI
nr:integrase, catalytic region, zinc finger, CCHC-type, peptidase aspartic, catalytic [Tanacetum cinerariifolium]